MATISFSQKPEAALKYLAAKKPELHFDYDEIMHEAHHKAFTVAKVTKLDLLSDIQRSLVKAREEGQPFAAWKKALVPTLKAKGWYGKTEVTNPKTGEVKEIYVGSRRLRNIFYTNTRVAYAVGRWEHQAQLEDAPYLRYVAVLDANTRPKHANNHGVVRHRDDPFWETNYPPNGWNCRCTVRAYSIESLKRRGWDKGLKATAHNVADNDWAYDVRTGSRVRLEAYAEKRVAAAPKAVGAVVAKELASKERVLRDKALNEMVDEVIVNENVKYAISAIEIGALTEWIIASLKKIIGVEVEATGVVLEKNQLLHASPKRKESYNQALRVEEIRQIVSVIEEAKEVYADTNKKNIVFVFDDNKNEDKVNKIIIDVNKKVKKFGKINTTVTFSKVDRANTQEPHMKRLK